MNLKALTPEQLVRTLKQTAQALGIAVATAVASAPADAGRASYEAHRDRAGQRQREQSKETREIGDLPAVVNPGRRAMAEASLRVFLETYFPLAFRLGWSQAHLDTIDALERTILRGERLARAMPRGTGKTTIFERAVLWAGLTGHRRFAVLIGETQEKAEELLDSIKNELECNELLLADFPEVLFPIAKLDRITQRAKGQTHQGEPTRMEWSGRSLTFPTIAESISSGFTIRVVGLTGSVRGMKAAMADGSIVRPDLVLLDDPQTDESARSPSQTDKRMKLINGAVLGLAGPDERLAAIVACTVICPDDLADRLLDRDQNPEWHGQRYSLLPSLPDNEAIWGDYADVRRDAMREEDPEAANRFYLEHREAMDAGAVVLWPQRIASGDVSAIQTAMHLKLDDEPTFWAEYQNRPLAESGGADSRLDVDLLSDRCTGLPHGIVPQHCTRVTAFIDVQKKLLWFMVVGWNDGFGGHIIDYGAWPDQKRGYFTKNDAKRTIARTKPGAGREAQLYHALNECTNELLSRVYVNEAATPMKIERMLIDSGAEADTVYQFCRESTHAAILMPSKGKGLRPTDTPLTERKRKPGVLYGHHWQVQRPEGRAIRHIFFDTNRWKTFIAARLKASKGDPGALTFFEAKGGARKGHRMLIDHLTAEFPKVDRNHDTGLELWDPIAGRDNDLLDCLVGSGVAASLIGAGKEAIGHAKVPVRRRRKHRAVSVQF